jgi:hypothetical protein
VRKLPLGGSLYQQQQHALARHVAGDQPTEGVRTAPTPSLPPTPCLADTAESRLPGGDILPSTLSTDETEKSLPQHDSGESDTMVGVEDVLKEDVPPGEQQQQSSASHACGDGSTSSSSALTGMAPPDLVSGTRDLSLAELEKDTDSTKDLDVVSAGNATASAASPTPPEVLDTPPDMPSTPPEMLGGVEDEEEHEDSSANNHSTASDLELPDAPVSEPGSPQVPLARCYISYRQS